MLVAGFFTRASGQILSVDFNGQYYNATESGFTGLPFGTAYPESTLVSPYTVNLTASTSVMQGQNGTFTPTVGEALYKDFARADGFGTLTLTIGGLEANTEYNLRSYNWLGEAAYADFDITFSPVNGTVGGTYVGHYDGSQDILSLDQFSTLMTLVSNNAGELSVQMVASSNTQSPYLANVINGFAVYTVPEPTATAMLGLAGVLWIARRRKTAR